ncbi:hypothetical protein [Paenibacillus sp. FJAT-26967]|uniref:hypothetical protein n=1 Tax=Paenibacillus sp. FJAT-26967 TaxID=1729690 RepID=UPI000839A7CE|nr:hypothetical protein [Paenibacillus sp. FJAT-26967]
MAQSNDKNKKDYYNEISNTAGGINTPPEREDKAATDPISGVVGKVMDKLAGDEDLPRKDK